MADMVQVLFIVAANFFAVAAMPYFYKQRFDGTALTLGVFAFIGLPLIVGMLQKQVHRTILPTAVVLLLLCPVVYVVTDKMPKHAEANRDAFFLAAFTTTVFVSAAWAATSFRSGKGPIAAIAALGLTFSALGIFVLLFLVMYLE